MLVSKHKQERFYIRDQAIKYKVVKRKTKVQMISKRTEKAYCQYNMQISIYLIILKSDS